MFLIVILKDTVCQHPPHILCTTLFSPFFKALEKVSPQFPQGEEIAEIAVKCNRHKQNWKSAEVVSLLRQIHMG